MGGPGASGSWTWTTSKTSSLRARIVRIAADASGASGAIEPLAAVGRLLPSGVTNDSGGGPSHGPRTRASWPWRRSSRANPSTCDCTPPGNDRLYGQISPTRSERSDRAVTGRTVAVGTEALLACEGAQPRFHLRVGRVAGFGGVGQVAVERQLDGRRHAVAAATVSVP